MTTPNIFISHRWAYGEDYSNVVSKFNYYGFVYRDYSVPEHDPLDADKVNKIKVALREQIRQCNYLIVFANMAIGNSFWCKFEIDVAGEYGKPILVIRPHGYAGNIPLFIQQADTEGGSVGFNIPAVIRKICLRLGHPAPVGV
ncbi:TIR domain-containing protein [Pseudomonas gingeri]|uniref:TIR domain-containing protein n=1 Tax=Pseudomonas gingeri TaxID=117681 RepID=A0A7Y8C3B2_9PSED|nr:TIR domain-containing protein [Pseudomonas gingeri]NWB98028.1 TIR domain-containing protein [Pseudomonas gingeri]